MKRTGKIARLPHALREQLNQRLNDGQPGVALLEWLNALPEVQAVLDQYFEGVPISPQNLSEWNNGGFLDWLACQEVFEQVRELAKHAEDLAHLGPLTDQLTTAINARFAALLMRMPLNEETPVTIRQQFNILFRLSRTLQQHRRHELQTRKEELTRPPAKSPVRPNPQPQPQPPAAPAPLTPRQSAQMDEWLNQIELRPALLPPLTTGLKPKRYPVLAGFYEKP